MALSKVARSCLESNFFLIEDILSSKRVNAVNKKRESGEFFSLYSKYRESPDHFFEYTGMTVDTFDYILLNIEEDIHLDCKRAVEPAEKLFLTLRYLGHGASMASLAQSYGLGRSTVWVSIYQTLKAIWKNFVHRHMPRPKSENLKQIANEFYLKWQFPNCFGSISEKCFSILHAPRLLVLQAISDADYKFIAIEVGTKNKKSKRAIFHSSRLNILLKENRFNVPPPQNLPGTDMTAPHVLIGDETHPLKHYLMRPYPSRSLNSEKIIFNERLSRARVTIECAFSVLISKFRIFLKCIELNNKHAKLIAKVSCLLHNIIREKDGERDKHFHQFWENFRNSDKNARSRSRSKQNNRATSHAILLRNQFQNYFVTHPLSE